MCNCPSSCGTYEVEGTPYRLPNFGWAVSIMVKCRCCDKIKYSTVRQVVK